MASTPKVLVADDDENILELVALYLKKDGFQVVTARDGREALLMVEQETPDLVVLDIMMPEKDGWTVCKEIQKHRRLPVIMLTAKSEDYDKILGLELGADDYVTKPFNPRELVARIKAVLRRLHESDTQPRLLVFNDLEINPTEYTVKRQEKLLPLTRKEMELLCFLAARPNHVFTRDQLLNQVWGYTYTGDTRTVDTHIKRIRSKLGPGEKWEIKTIWAVGYKFEVCEG